MATFQSINDAIETILQGIAGIAEVKDFETLKFSGFPGATVVSLGNTAETLDSTKNNFQYVYRVRIIDENAEDPEATENRMRALIQEVMDALNTSSDLSGEVTFLLPTDSEWGYADTEVGSVRVVQIPVLARFDQAFK